VAAATIRTAGNLWEQLASGRVVHRFESVVLIATLALIPILIVENESKSQAWREAATVANWLIWIVFALEIAFVLTVAPRKAAALRAHWLDLTIVVVTTPLFGRFLSSLRLVRLARLLRLLRLTAVLTRILQRERSITSATTFRFVGLLTVLVVVVSGAVESLVDTHDFPTLWDGIWWSVVTVTTVGYGDIYPTSVGGRLIAMLVMLVGIGFLSVLTATIASQFVRTDQGSENDEVLRALSRIETELAELKGRLGVDG
jgi:voltage-gated potassium channel